MVKVVIVCTSAGELKGHPTGLWIEELAAPYYIFKDAGFDVVIASPDGGACPIDKASFGEGFFTEYCKKFMHDGEAVGSLTHSLKVSAIDATSVDAIFLVGGHGTVVDFPESVDLKTIVETLSQDEKIVSAVCHGLCGLVSATNSDGTPLVKGRCITGFTNAEEEAVQLTSVVPFLVEDKLKELGANYESEADWSDKVCVDGKLVTGQNPQSSASCAHAVVKLLKA